MKKVCTILALAALAGTLSGYAQAAPETVFDINGTNWTSWDHHTKVIYVAGLSAGYLMADKTDDGYSNLTMAQEVVAIDDCFDDPRNLKLPIVSCWAVAVGQGKGLSRTEMEAGLAKMREQWK